MEQAGLTAPVGCGWAVAGRLGLQTPVADLARDIVVFVGTLRHPRRFGRAEWLIAPRAAAGGCARADGGGGVGVAVEDAFLQIRPNPITGLGEERHGGPGGPTRTAKEDRSGPAPVVRVVGREHDGQRLRVLLGVDRPTLAVRKAVLGIVRRGR